MKINAAQLKKYNANSRGIRSEDCVKRAISLGFDVPYPEVAKLLNAKMHEKRQTLWNILPVFSAVILDLGGEPYVDLRDMNMTLNEFADDYSNGSYIVLTANNASRDHHLVCVRDGDVWDSWDSRDQYVHGYWKAHTNKGLRDIDKSVCLDYATKYLQPVVSDTITNYVNKRNWKYSTYSVEPVGGPYKVVATCNIKLEKDEVVTKDRSYSFDVKLTIEPSWTDEEIVNFIKTTGKTRAYDRMYTINEQEKKLKEAYEVINKADQGSLYSLNSELMTDQEKRFINSLPGWIMPLIRNIRIYRPGQYPDSYMLKITKHPDDTLHPDQKSFILEGWDANEIKMQVDRYKENFEIEGIDYYKDW